MREADLGELALLGALSFAFGCLLLTGLHRSSGGRAIDGAWGAVVGIVFGGTDIACLVNVAMHRAWALVGISIAIAAVALINYIAELRRPRPPRTDGKRPSGS